MLAEMMRESGKYPCELSALPFYVTEANSGFKSLSLSTVAKKLGQSFLSFGGKNSKEQKDVFACATRSEIFMENPCHNEMKILLHALNFPYHMNQYIKIN